MRFCEYEDTMKYIETVFSGLYARLGACIAVLSLCLTSAGCQRSSDEVWNDTKTAGRHVQRGARSLGGKQSSSKQVQNKVLEALVSLSENPRPNGCKKLVGTDSWRFRVGEYRIVYSIEDNVLLIEVIRVAHRKEVYR